jgi:hypothetical protein
MYLALLKYAKNLYLINVFILGPIKQKSRKLKEKKSFFSAKSRIFKQKIPEIQTIKIRFGLFLDE